MLRSLRLGMVPQKEEGKKWMLFFLDIHKPSWSSGILNLCNRLETHPNLSMVPYEGLTVALITDGW